MDVKRIVCEYIFFYVGLMLEPYEHTNHTNGPSDTANDWDFLTS